MLFNGRQFLLLIAATSLVACQQTESADGNEVTSGNGAAAASDSSKTQSRTILENASASADLSTFVGALKKAGLGETLSGAGPYTVFAPANAGFQKLPAGAAEELMQPGSKARLTRLLTDHIVPGVVTSKDLTAAIERGGGKTQIATMGGGTLTAAQANGAITITDANGTQARIVQADMLQSNGVIHSVDSVLATQ